MCFLYTGEESVRPRGMTNVSRVLMSDQPDDFLTRQEAANRRREAKVLEERARLEAETAEKEAAAMRTTPKITDAAKVSFFLFRVYGQLV